jgi:hypothetical protein
MAAKDYVAPVQANWPQAVAQPPCCQTQATAFSPAASYVPMLPVVNATGSFFNGQDYGLGFTMVPTSIVPTNAVPANNALTYGAFYPTGVIESPGKTSTLFPAASKSVLDLQILLQSTMRKSLLTSKEQSSRSMKSSN